METSKSALPDCGCGRKADRYVTFNDIDCTGNARQLMECIERNIPGAQRSAAHRSGRISWPSVSRRAGRRRMTCF